MLQLRESCQRPFGFVLLSAQYMPNCRWNMILCSSIRTTTMIDDFPNRKTRSEACI